MTDAKHEGLKLEYRNAVVQSRTSKGRTFFGDLRAMFRQRGLTDEEMDEIDGTIPLL